MGRPAGCAVGSGRFALGSGPETMQCSSPRDDARGRRVCRCSCSASGPSRPFHACACTPRCVSYNQSVSVSLVGTAAWLRLQKASSTVIRQHIVRGVHRCGCFLELKASTKSTPCHCIQTTLEVAGVWRCEERPRIVASCRQRLTQAAKGLRCSCSDASLAMGSRCERVLSRSMANAGR
jgi:hypothetical protein